MRLVCRYPKLYTGPTPATLFRQIGDLRPTLLCDQTERLSKSAQGLIQELLLTGYNTDSVIPRIVHGQVVDFPIGCPKACALIGELESTLRDRCIIIPMMRGTPPRNLERDYDRARALGFDLRTDATLTVGSDQMQAEIAEAYHDIEIPHRFREAQLWRPLFVLCDLLCPKRMQILTTVASDMASQKRTGKPIRMSRDLEDLADREALGRLLIEQSIEICVRLKLEKIRTDDRILGLKQIPAAPWRKYEDEGLNAVKLAKLVEPFGVRPRRHWFGPKSKPSSQHFGYTLAALKQALAKNPSPHHP